MTTNFILRTSCLWLSQIQHAFDASSRNAHKCCQFIVAHYPLIEYLKRHDSILIKKKKKRQLLLTLQLKTSQKRFGLYNCVYLVRFVIHLTLEELELFSNMLAWCSHKLFGPDPQMYLAICNKTIQNQLQRMFSLNQNTKCDARCDNSSKFYCILYQFDNCIKKLLSLFHA